MTRKLRDPLDPVRWRKPLALAVAGLAVVLGLSLGVPAVLQARAAADRAAVSALVDGFTVPGGVDEPCTHGASRCWTTTATSQEVRSAAEARLRSAGVRIVDAGCLASTREGLDDTCSVSGTLNGRVVVLSAGPRLAKDPPIQQIALDVALIADSLD